MKKSRFTEEQIIKAIKRQESGEKQRISAVTWASEWKSKFGGMDVSEAQKLRALEEENRRLRQIVADQALDNQALRFLVEKKF